ncbi:hypothetical protein [Kitasatospora atroaurantiaca]|uniref:hypothetical protein n=1 Tax=Kitasatospora atroaurantiaca TaxID=285545 RepID=UPI0011A3E7A2|nr:hypothetical protein [Kitasatospora atroaurantiaca]
MTIFGFALVTPELVRPSEEEPDPEVEIGEEYWTVVLHGSGLLDVAGFAFRIGGFGHADWKFDVGYDMSTFMEELPGLIELLERGEGRAEIDLYSQGVERTLLFEADGPVVRIEALSRTDWRPDPAVEILPMAELDRMVGELTRAFAQGLAVVDPEFAAQEPFTTWLR